MLITASKKDQSYLNYPQSLQPTEDSSQSLNKEVKTASTFILTFLASDSYLSEVNLSLPEMPYYSQKCMKMRSEGLFRLTLLFHFQHKMARFISLPPAIDCCINILLILQK